MILMVLTNSCLVFSFAFLILQKDGVMFDTHLCHIFSYMYYSLAVFLPDHGIAELRLSFRKCCTRISPRGPKGTKKARKKESKKKCLMQHT